MDLRLKAARLDLLDGGVGIRLMTSGGFGGLGGSGGVNREGGQTT